MSDHPTHPLFADTSRTAGVFSFTTESLSWDDPDYDATAGAMYLRPSSQPDSTPHLFFVDVCARTNDGREIVLERMEGGKMLYSLLQVEREAQAVKPIAAVHACTAIWRDGVAPQTRRKSVASRTTGAPPAA